VNGRTPPLADSIAPRTPPSGPELPAEAVAPRTPPSWLFPWVEPLVPEALPLAVVPWRPPDEVLLVVLLLEGRCELFETVLADEHVFPAAVTSVEVVFEWSASPCFARPYA